MANRDVHVAVGMIAGALFAAQRTNGQATFGDILLGGFGGYVGARLPDIIDPPTCPQHRHIGHGMIPATYCGAAYLKSLNQWQETLRTTAADLRRARQFIADPKERANSGIAESVALLIAGVLPGLLAGYASHLALDLTTPSGLPLLVRGF